jgi:AraC-like DNA-binding protein
MLLHASSIQWPTRRCTSADRMMWITPDRMFYAGLLGAPWMHSKGAIVLYVALEGPVRIRVEGGAWQTTELAIVQPNVPHQAACDARHIVVACVEPETVDRARLPALLRSPSGAVEAPEFAAHVRRCHARMVAPGYELAPQPGDFDRTIFGEALHARSIDPRIEAVLARIKADPSKQMTAEECAAEARLSFWRFLHLFKNEVGVPFRSFRNWRRARSLLHYVHSASNLAYLALDAGYPDSTHFSHSIRHSYGLKPKDIISGSRKLRVIEQRI